MLTTTRGVARFLLLLVLMMPVTAPAGITSAQETETEGIDGDSYVSPTFGYSFSWNTDIWFAADEFSEDGYDFVALEADEAALYVEGIYFYQGDPEECVDGERLRIAEEAGFADVDPLLDDDGVPIEGATGDYVYAIFDVPESADGELLASVVYIECRSLVPNSVVLIITAFVDPDDLEYQLDAVFDVAEDIQTDDNAPVALGEGDLERIVRETALDINDYWEAVFDDFGEVYDEPKFITFTGPTETECGDAFPGESGSFYCPSDLTIYLDVDDSLANDLSYGVVFFQVVLAHEIAHHVQELLLLTGCVVPTCGEPEGSLAIELQADCFAGVWMQDAAARSVIDGNELERVEVAIKTFLGDPIDVPADDPDAHGTGDQRFEMFMAGYEIGLAACGW